MLQLFVNFIYSLIQSSWMVSAVLVKFILLAQLGYAYKLEGGLKQNFERVVQDFSKETVTALVLLGLLSIVSGVELKPVFELPSYFVAASYFGYLFWKF